MRKKEPPKYPRKFSRTKNAKYKKINSCGCRSNVLFTQAVGGFQYSEKLNEISWIHYLCGKGHREEKLAYGL